MSIRPATHAGSWYSNNPTKLKNQLDQFFAKARSLKTPLSGEDASNGIDGARILIGPHAGYILVKDWQNLLMLGIPQKSKGCFY